MLDFSVWEYLLGGLVYTAGALLYMSKMPERCKPGAFDTCGHSHSLFHFCVLLGCMIHYWQGLALYHDREHFIC